MRFRFSDFRLSSMYVTSSQWATAIWIDTYDWCIKNWALATRTAAWAPANKSVVRCAVKNSMTALNYTSIANCMMRMCRKHRMDRICAVIIANTIHTHRNNTKSICATLIWYTTNQLSHSSVAGVVFACEKFKDSIRIYERSTIHWPSWGWHCRGRPNAKAASINANARHAADGWVHPLRLCCTINRMQRHEYSHAKSVRRTSSEF